MAGPNMVPVFGLCELPGEVDRRRVLDVIGQYQLDNAAQLGGVRGLVLEEPKWWSLASRNCGLGCREHIYEFVCLIPVAVCMNGNMDVAVALHRSWSGKWSVATRWSSLLYPSPNVSRLTGTFEATYAAMEHISSLPFELQKLLRS